MTVPAFADGGLLRLTQPAGGFVVSVFTAPTPLRAGPVDISVLVQSSDDGEAILDARVVLRLKRSGAPEEDRLVVPATHAEATNKLLYVALVELPDPGEWELTTAVRGRTETAEVTCTVGVAPPLGPLISLWPLLTLPPVLVLLFGLHQWLAYDRNLISR